jgi:hypothetical protein
MNYTIKLALVHHSKVAVNCRAIAGGLTGSAIGQARHRGSRVCCCMCVRTRMRL